MLRTAAIRTVLFLALAASAGFFIYNDRTSLTPSSTNNAAAVFAVDTVTPEKLARTYGSLLSSTSTEDKIKVFIMPGHEPDYGGAEYGSLKERDMTVVLSENLADFLRSNSHYEVLLGRDKNGWNPALTSYFATHKKEIVAWRDSQKKTMRALVKNGSFEPAEDPVPHEAAPDDVALRLYGINKWIGENDFDIAIHVHFNDYGSRGRGAGEFSGFSIYVPDKQYSNARAAKSIGETISKRLSTYIVQSDAPRESAGVIEDQTLVALGSNNTSDVPSILVEYGYIYEPQFQNPTVRGVLLKEYAYQTYLGLQDFFLVDAPPVPYETNILPYVWKTDIRSGSLANADTLALQFALASNLLYPPSGKTLRDCPFTGAFRGCTKASVAAFQKKFELQGEDGFVGWKTRNTLNQFFK